MTAGHTVSHAVSHTEEATGHYRGTLEGIQLWVALPQTKLDGGVATVLIGQLDGSCSTARHGTPLVGVDLTLREPTRALLIIGEPFEGPILMWWNFVGCTRQEIGAAYASWAAQDDRFGAVASSFARIPARAPYWQQAPGSR